MMMMVSVNPLQIPHVLQNIFQHCSFDDLKSIRTVCRQWKNESFKIFASRSRLQFTSHNALSNFMNTFGSEPNYSISEKVAHSSPQVFSLDLCSSVLLLGTDFQSFTSPMRPFLQKYATVLKTLEINHQQVSHSASGIESFIEVLIAENVRLESLIISGNTLTYRQNESLHRSIGRLPTVKTLKIVLRCRTFPKDGYLFFRQLFYTLPNLESVSCINYSFPCLYTLQIVDLPSHLTSLHMHLWNGTGLDTLASRNYLIHTLKLDIEVVLSRSVLHEFIQSFGGTLKHLELVFRTTHEKECYNYSHNATTFPNPSDFKLLSYLRLVGYWGDLYFLKRIPVLKRVIIENMQMNIAFPSGTRNEELIPVKTRKIINFFDGLGHSVEL